MATAATIGAANAVSVTLTGIANTSVGLVTAGTSATLLSGNAYFYSTAVDLTVAQVAGITTRAAFEALIGADPGAVRGPVAFTAGAFTSSAATEMGAVGNNTYLFLESAGGFGIFQGPTVPSLGAVTMNPANMIEDLKGTSTLTNVSGTNSGFQLVPEPSIALLGALGVFGLIRRRR
ncbi:PEP-CTERM sorting domain-containing protein [Luteolibacter soli]|uniref:PEP-CTERM sorting domain-containing protein n=1 Tax=Luteolibacter soli TaxID=3135280 RepID=A0ABU9B2G1_9BACT